ncbi:MAG: hypothetical protein QOJ42_2693, partial [Acidobacteriaceae bacterium]|nr:hypothetical protein [Acidobacteriaceae bacterium]
CGTAEAVPFVIVLFFQEIESSVFLVRFAYTI